MFQQPPLKFLPPFLKVVALFSLMMLSMQIMFYCGAFLVHGYFGVENAELFMKDVNLQTQNPVAALVLQGLGSGFGGFLLPALMFSVLATGNITDALMLNRFPTTKQLSIAIGITFFSGVFIAVLVDLNKAIPLPPSLAFLNEMQAKYDALIESFFSGVTFKRFLLMTLVLAVLPAVGEELFFRGIVQSILSKTALGVHGGIVFTGLAFSLMHFEFQNLLAILFMGVMLGYLFFFTQSIWTCIIAHFINNFLQVLLKYLHAIGKISSDPTTAESLPLYITLSAGIITLLLFVLLQKSKTSSTDSNAFIHQAETEQ